MKQVDVDRFIARYKSKDGKPSLHIPVVGNYRGGYDLRLTEHGYRVLSHLKDSGQATLSYISPLIACYYLTLKSSAVSAKSEAPMFDVFKVDPEPVSTHFVEDTMIVTVQRNYNSKQVKHLIAWIMRKVDGLATVEQSACSTLSVTCLHVTFKTVGNFQQNQARVKALATMFAKCITPRAEPVTVKAAQLSLF